MLDNKKKCKIRSYKCMAWGETTEMMMITMTSKVPTHATKAYRGNEGTAPLILNLDTR
jgi:hypothetical protein